MRWLLVLLVGGCATSRAPELAHHAPPPPPEPPRTHRVVVESSSIEILPAMWWQGATATLTPQAEHALDLIAHTLEAADDIRVLEIRAFGGGVSAWQLGQERAQVLVDGLVRRHVDPHRLVGRGFADGPSAPVLTILDRTP
jgi:hypothetical protein